MRSSALSIFLLLTFGVGVRSHDSSVNLEVLSFCGEDAVLGCDASAKPGVQYRSVTWYKVSDAPSQQLTGLVMKRLTQHNSTVQRYKGLVRDVELLADTQSLVLHNVTPQDAGRYRCFFSAPLGHQNQEGDIHLRVYECTNDDVRKSEENDMFYLILAITLLIVSLLMLYLSYTCLRNTLISHKNKFSKETSSRTYQIKDFIVNLESKGIVSKILPQEYV